MILTIVQICIAVYATDDHTGEPKTLECFDYHAPVRYDVEQCPGEVTTPEDDWTHATCEVSEVEDEVIEIVSGPNEATPKEESCFTSIESDRASFQASRVASESPSTSPHPPCSTGSPNASAGSATSAKPSTSGDPRPDSPLPDRPDMAFGVSDVTLWPTDNARIYRVQWFNPTTEQFHEDYVRRGNTPNKSTE